MISFHFRGYLNESQDSWVRREPHAGQGFGVSVMSPTAMRPIDSLVCSLDS